jgi:hypothetical protein
MWAAAAAAAAAAGIGEEKIAMGRQLQDVGKVEHQICMTRPAHEWDRAEEKEIQGTRMPASTAGNQAIVSVVPTAGFFCTQHDVRSPPAAFLLRMLFSLASWWRYFAVILNFQTARL